MYRLYVDESYLSDHYYVSGILVDEKADALLVNSLDKLAISVGADNHVVSPEFHGHALMNGNDDWTHLRGNFGAAISVYKEVLQTIANAGAEVFIEGVDVQRLNARYRYPDPPYEVVLRHMLERVNEICIRRKATCQVIADMVPKEKDFIEAIRGYTRVKTPGYRAQRLECIAGDVRFVDSKASRGVQSADMVAYIMRRHLEHHSASKASKRATKRLARWLDEAIVYQRKWIP